MGNLIARFSGKKGKAPLALCAHMDTVTPCENIKPRIENDVICSDGSTILGADDKSGIVEIIEAIHRLQEQNFKYAPLEIIFTVSEEIGLLGAKHLDYSLIKSKVGYALDGGEVGSVVVKAPTLNAWKVTVYGRASHSGGAPEKGISAIRVASKALAKIPHGRIDDETTVNVGSIIGGRAHNIVPEKVVVEGEVRSHNPHRLKNVSNEIIKIFEETAEKYFVKLQKKVEHARITSRIDTDFPLLKIDENENFIRIAVEAAEEVGITPKIETSGGGSDANIFFGNGLCVPVLGTGMKDVHSKQENISISDLENGTLWIMEIIKKSSK